MKNVRPSIVAGSFYPADKATLERAVRSFLGRGSSPARSTPMGMMIPHAGYLYSGHTAGASIAQSSIVDTVILLGPKHTRYGAMAAVSAADAWQTPLGRVPVDRELADTLTNGPSLVFDDDAHCEEHSLEVILPFLQVSNPHVRIVPIALGMHDLSTLVAIASHVADVVAAHPCPVQLVCSTDMSHHVPLDIARRLDGMAIEQIRRLDPGGLFNTVKANRISMCGVVPATVTLEACRQLGATRATLVDYTTSADVTGDEQQVVGYAGMVME